jgi:hypothetical protein
MKPYINMLAAIASPLSLLIGRGRQEIKPTELLTNTTFKVGNTSTVSYRV